MYGSEIAPDRVNLVLLALHYLLKDSLELSQRKSVKELVQVHRRLIFGNLRRQGGGLIEMLQSSILPVSQFIGHQPVLLIFQ